MSSSQTSTSESESAPGPSRVVHSLLETLKSPTPSSLARKRTVSVNPPPKGKRACRGAVTASNPKSVSPTQRVKENPDESLTVSNGRLFSRACREELSLKSSSVKSHLRSTKHQERKTKRHSIELQERDIAIALATYSKEVHNKGESLPLDMQVYRVKVVSAFLRAGVPLSKVDLFRDILEENAFRLCDRRHMSDLIPFLLSQEQARIKEIEGQHLAIIFDGTTRLGEALAIVVRVISEDFQVMQRLVRLQLLSKSLTGEEIARELITVLSVGYGINPNLVICAMRDGASTNNVAMRTLNVLYSRIFDVTCFSHALNCVGNHFDVPIS